MRVLVIVAAALAALYAGYWAVGSTAVERGARAALAAMADRGWRIDYADLSTRGFPSRFDTTVTAAAVGTPGGRTRWEAPLVQVLSLSYRPNRVIVVWPEGQRLLVGDRTLLVEGDLRASASVELGGDLALGPVTVEGDHMHVSFTWPLHVIGAQRVLAALRPAEGQPNAYDVFLDAEDLQAPGMQEAAQLRIEAVATLDQPLDRTLVGGTPDLLDLSVRSLSMTAGGGEIAAEGYLAVAPDGTLEGTITLTATDWEPVLAAAQGLGAIDAGLAAFYGRFLEEAAAGAETVQVPFDFAEGRVSALGLRIGPAPRLTL